MTPINEAPLSSLAELLLNPDYYQGITIKRIDSDRIYITFEGETLPHHVYMNNLLQFIEIQPDLNIVRYGYLDQQDGYGLKVDEYMITNADLSKLSLAKY